MKLFFILFISTILVGCATPPEVKLLSQKQIEYFVFAIDAVSKQSEVLTSVAHDIAQDKAKSIDSRFEKIITRSQKMISSGKLSEEQAKQVADDIANATKTAQLSKQNLMADLAEIERINQELVTYISSMKDVQIALDAYLQSEKAGEKILTDTLNHKSVKGLVDSASHMLSSVTTNIGLTESLINSMQGK